MAGTSPAMTKDLDNAGRSFPQKVVSYKSFHSGLLASINLAFHFHDQCFMLCSRWIAA